MDTQEFLAKTARKLAWDVRRVRAPAPRVEVLYEAPDAGRYADIWPGPQYVHRVAGPVYIEPRYGWAITEAGALIEASLTPQVAFRWRQAWRHGTPALADFLRAREDPARVQQVGEVVSLRHCWEWNYYHFHLDCLGKLPLFQEAGVPERIAVTLGGFVNGSPWARELAGRLFPDGSDRLLVADPAGATFLRADAVYYCRTLQPYRRRMDPVLDRMGVPVPPGSANGRRLFLTRRPPAPRTAANLDALERVASDLGFEVIDAAALPVAEQIRQFGEARFLVALHGAGITNVIYRRGAPLSILELHADGYVTADMQNLSAEYGYRHNRLSGPGERGDSQRANFHIDPARLRDRIREMLEDELSGIGRVV